MASAVVGQFGAEADGALKETLSRGELAVFVGAGLSIGAGLPGWYELAAELSARMRYSLPPREWATSEALIDAIQAYVNRNGLNNLILYLKARLDTVGRSPTDAHLALAALPISLVFTSNYDDLLEQAYRAQGKHVRVVVRDTDMPFMSREVDTVNIVKMYGDLAQPETVVLARQQYEAFFVQRPQMLKLLEVELTRAAVLYLGWSHTDPHFNQVFGDVRQRVGKMIRSGYAVMFDVDEARREELERRSVKLVGPVGVADRTAALAAWLTALGKTAI